MTSKQHEHSSSPAIHIGAAVAVVVSIILGFVLQAWWLFAVAGAVTIVLAVEWGEAGPDTD